MAGFGGAVKLTGESEYRKALNQITQNLKTVSAEMRATSSSFEAGNASMSETTARAQSLQTALSSQGDALAVLKSQLADMTASYQQSAASHQALLARYDNEKAKLEQIGQTLGTSSKEYQEQEQVVNALGQEVQASTKSFDAQTKALQDLQTKTANAETTYNQTSQSLKNLGKEAEDSGKKAQTASNGGWTVMKQVLADLASSAIQSALNGLKQLGQAAIDTGKQALSSYGQYEQLEGGVKKIFGDDLAQQVISNANNAFSTAGMSANQYMETVTSFSATLLQGLGDDTSKAAQYADMAIRNMSDNANTFGTDIKSIQAAYQGFAKDNYTMLDNLKLGYGGTASEMARLINESGVLGDSMEVTAQTVKDVPFDVMIQAIDKTQERMGIMDTTAKEAAGTIQGSTGSMAAAWQNMLRGMADENANFEELAKNFMSTLITEDGKGGVIGTIVPRIANVITGMSSAIQQLLPMLVNTIVPVIQSNMPVIVKAVEGALQTIVSVLPTIINAITPLIPQIVTMLLGMMPQIIEAGVQIVVSLITGITEMIPQLIAMLPTIISTIASTLLSNIPLIVTAGMELLVSLITGITQGLPELVAYIPEIVNAISTTLLENTGIILDAAVQIILALISGLVQSLPNLAAAVPQIINTIISTMVGMLAQVVSAGVRIVTSIAQGIGSAISKVAAKAREVVLSVYNTVVGAVSDMIEAGGNLVRGIWSGISANLEWIKGKISGWVGDVVSFCKRILGIHSPSTVFRDQIGKYMAEGIGEGFVSEMSNVEKMMESAIPTSFDVSPSINSRSGASGYSYWEMVSAFKEALTQVKIELDDEVAGRFVTRTVERAVYSY